MKDIELFRKIIGLEVPWNITEITVDTVEKRITVDIEYPSKIKACCPKCGTECTQYDHMEHREWRHLDTMQFKTFLKCAIPRVQCPEHGTLRIPIPWCNSSSQGRFTDLFERLAVDVSHACKTTSGAASLLGISWDELNSIKKKQLLEV